MEFCSQSKTKPHSNLVIGMIVYHAEAPLLCCLQYNSVMLPHNSCILFVEYFCFIECDWSYAWGKESKRRKLQLELISQAHSSHLTAVIR